MRKDRRARLTRQPLPTLPGVRPQTPRDILQAEADKPLKGRNDELPANSLFGDAHLQRSLF